SGHWRVALRSQWSADRVVSITRLAGDERRCRAYGRRRAHVCDGFGSGLHPRRRSRSSCGDSMRAMPDSARAELLTATEAWWHTGIVEISAESIRVRGYDITALLGRVTMAEMLWLMVRGELPRKDAALLLEAAMLAAATHGPHAPSIAIA